MGCCGNLIGDTPGVIPFRRMPRIAPLSPDAPQPHGPVWRSRRWDTIVLEAVSRVGRKPSIPRCSSGSTAMPQGSTAGPKPTTLPYRRSEIPNRCARSRPSPAIFIVSPTGSRPARSRLSRWNRPACTGSRSSRSSKSAASRSCSSTARHIKNVPGRKTDVLDCQWIQELHSVGLLRGSFRPAAEIASLRAYLRHREKLVQGAASHIQRMQKALVQMNLQLHNVISDITGVTGMRILRDIVAGVTDPMALAAHRDYRCRASEEEIAASLTGNYRAEHLFVLRQNLELFDTFQRQIQTCDGEIESLLHHARGEAAEAQDARPVPTLQTQVLRQRTPFRDPRSALPPCRSRPDPDRFHRAVHRTQAHRGDRDRHESLADLQALHLVADSCAQEQDHRRPADQLQDSALGQPSRHRPAHVCHGRRPHFHGPRRLLPPHRLRIGKPKAITATARKLAILVYRTLKGDLDYNDPGTQAYEEQHRERTLRNLRNRARQLGFGLVNVETGELLHGPVT